MRSRSTGLSVDLNQWQHVAAAFEPGVGVRFYKNEQEVLIPAAKTIFEQVLAGTVRPIVDSAFPLDREGAIAAHMRLHERKNIGKVVLSAEPVA